MKIRIYETDFEGNPVECTGEYFSGRTAMDIVNAMKMNPFQASLTPLDFMRWMLASIEQEKFTLPDDEGKGFTPVSSASYYPGIRHICT